MSSGQSVALWSQPEAGPHKSKGHHRKVVAERLRTSPIGAIDGFQADADVALGRRPRRHADSHRPTAVPRGSPTPANAIVLYTFDEKAYRTMAFAGVGEPRGTA